MLEGETGLKEAGGNDATPLEYDAGHLAEKHTQHK
jgi:hypothetical protein